MILYIPELKVNPAYCSSTWYCFGKSGCEIRQSNSLAILGGLHEVIIPSVWAPKENSKEGGIMKNKPFIDLVPNPLFSTHPVQNDRFSVPPLPPPGVKLHPPLRKPSQIGA